ncbi:MAG TPA: HAD hydrolase family protein [Phycisphaerales bacterium]|nr:HAD hydrolase family protein [Phycisphaerales bacterium]
MPSHRYDFIAIDLDGTLLCPRGRVSETNARAIHRARHAGVKVSVCTGRGYNECKHVTSQIDQVEPVVVAGGAILSHARTGRTLHRFPMNPALVRRLVGTLTSHGHAALVLKDPAADEDPSQSRHGASGYPSPGHDYLIVSPKGEKAIDPITMWWFREHKIKFHVVPTLDDDEHPGHTVRVGVCGTRGRTLAAADELQRDFAGEVVFHHFGAVVPGDHQKRPEDQIVILEAFDRSVNKWSAIRWLADRDGIDHARIAAIGNDINDVAMLSAAGLGVAMENAIPEAKAAARMHTRANDADGVAHAIEMILAGEW